MKLFPQMLVLASMACGLMLASSSADARSRNNNHPWCLETGMGRGGGTMFDCRFSSREQCVQSRVAHGDRCMRNPRKR